MQQDAHEFLNFLLNSISETLTEERRREQANGIPKSNALSSKKPPVTIQNGDYTKWEISLPF
jgi:ubiquitin C-terminal hydrolase